MFRGNSLAVQWLGLGDFTAVASISGQGTKITQATQQSQKKKGGGGGRFIEEHLTVTYNNNQTLSITCVPTVENPMNGEQKMYLNIRAYKIKGGGGRGMSSEKFSHSMFNSKTYCS